MTNASRESRAEQRGARGDLLVRGDDAVHVARAARRRAATTSGRDGARTPPPPAPTGSSGARSARRRRAGRGRPPSWCRAAVRANVVLPAPGVATARKSGAADSTKRSRAAFCQGRRRTVRVIGTADASDRSCRRAPKARPRPEAIVERLPQWPLAHPVRPNERAALACASESPSSCSPSPCSLRRRPSASRLPGRLHPRPPSPRARPARSTSSPTGS